MPRTRQQQPLAGSQLLRRTSAFSPVLGVRMATGSYTGNGAVTQAIVGVGFQPVALWVYSQNVGYLRDWAVKSDQDGLNCAIYRPSTTRWDYIANQVISLDADGFTVNGAVPSQLNTLNDVFTYIAFR